MDTKIIVNGEPRQLVEPTSLEQLLQALQLAPELVAVELNRQLVPRSTRHQVWLRAGDEVEIVTLVGGG